MTENTETENIETENIAASSEEARAVTGENAALAKKEARRREFILSGRLWSVIVRISLPLMLLNAFNFLLTIIDTIFAASISTKAISAVAVMGQINSMIASLGTGLASGGMIIISRLIGRRDYEKAKTTANTMVFLAFLIAIFMAVAVAPFTVPILRLIGTNEDLIETGSGYFAIQLINTGVTLFTGIFLGLEKARGRTNNVLFCNLAVAVVKVFLTAMFIYGLGSAEIYTIALSTLIAHLMLAVYVVIRLAAPKYIFRFSYKNKDLSGKFLKPMLLLSLPIFVGKFVFSLGKVIINQMGMRYGSTEVGALGVSNNMGGTVTNILGSVEDSASLVISMNLGQKSLKRAINAFYLSFIFNLALSVTGVILLTIFNDPLVNLFAKGDAEYAAMVTKIFSYEKLGIIALGINASVLGLLYGFGFTRMSMIINLSRLFVFRIPALFIMVYFTPLGFESLGIAMLISNAAIGIMSVVIGLIYLRKIKRQNITDELKI